MKKYKLISTILLIAVLASVFIMPTMAIDDPSPVASSVVLMDTATGNSLYSKNAEEQIFPASLTKIMTVLLAIEAYERGEVELSDVVTASENSTFDLIEDGSTAGIVVGEEMSLQDLLYCAMVKSANEACNIIAEHVSGSISAFVTLMNVRATELGCTGTNFSNTHGLPSTTHYTTAQDMATIALAASSHTLFMQICNTAEITISATNKSEARKLVNTNGLITNNAEPYKGYYYEYASGIKTGHTDAAGYCLISTAKKDGISLLCVVMGGKATPTADGLTYGNFTDSINLYNWAFGNYSYRDILKTTDLVEEVAVAMGNEADHVAVHPQTAVRALLPNDDDLQSFVQHITIYSRESGEELIAPIEAGEVLGTISIERDGVIYGSSSLVADSSVSLSYNSFIAQKISEIFSKPIVIIILMVVLLLIAVYIFLVIRYRRSRKEYLRLQRTLLTDEVYEVENRQIKQVNKQPKKQVNKQASKPVEKKIPAPKDSEPEIDYLGMFSSSEEPSNTGKQISSEEQAERDYFEEFFGKK